MKLFDECTSEDFKEILAAMFPDRVKELYLDRWQKEYFAIYSDGKSDKRILFGHDIMDGHIAIRYIDKYMEKTPIKDVLIPQHILDKYKINL